MYGVLFTKINRPRRSVFELQKKKIEEYRMQISVKKSKVLRFIGKHHVHSKLITYKKPVEQVPCFKYLGYN